MSRIHSAKTAMRIFARVCVTIAVWRDIARHYFAATYSRWLHTVAFIPQRRRDSFGAVGCGNSRDSN